ncbi:SusD/RagB family nutrient-binding outer membrane lipoprotein [Chryseolinea lacunae]|uniref:SusD/RagB family nutrient-binding outer membrane lipoprotein n=1 Tax=Chryseolinea lacunae TaxID=2801331 RepID=A0ABS1KK35_9BACT|nr:SusD/RagB family nutrient-binding outer membrane lipoprotein [Chryseolinea lacunae]MBL0739618.1 SusD/RagB family nutrient-binding outer membrane lipoprotein [Chryseolinea lacunae]
MRPFQKIFTVALTVASLVGCQNYDDLVKNPNLPESVPPSLLLTGVLEHMNNQNAWSGKQGSQSAAQFYLSTYDYYGTNNYDQTPFTKTENNFEYVGTLSNLVQMELEAKKGASIDRNPYAALSKFLKAYYFNLMSQKMGDLPLSEALQRSDKTTPKYDTQKEIYIQILKWLDEANSDLSAIIATNNAGCVGAYCTGITGDFYYGNSLASWQRVVNSFTLRVLISLSKKEADGDLNIKQKFAAIVNDPAKYPLMEKLADNLQYVYNSTYNPYPKNPTSQGRDAQRENVGSAFLDLTTKLKDPRTFIAATPAPALLAAGKTFDSFDAYAGAEAGLSMGDLGNNAQGGKYSFINALRYYADFNGSKAEPSIIIGYPELCFNIAEGINRGWAGGDAEAWYLKGINASMNFFGISEGSAITVANNLATQVYGTITVSLTTYLAQPDVKYKGGPDGLTQILNQKYIAFWQNSNWEAFFNQRRTGVPAFSQGAGSGNGNKIAVRWQYPVAEAAANPTSYKQALDRQFSGEDDLNGKLWIIQ